MSLRSVSHPLIDIRFSWQGLRGEHLNYSTLCIFPILNQLDIVAMRFMYLVNLINLNDNW